MEQGSSKTMRKAHPYLHLQRGKSVKWNSRGGPASSSRNYRSMLKGWGPQAIRDPCIHLNIATCKWWLPSISVWKKQHVSNGCKVYLFGGPEKVSAKEERSSAIGAGARILAVYIC